MMRACGATTLPGLRQPDLRGRRSADRYVRPTSGPHTPRPQMLIQGQLSEDDLLLRRFPPPTAKTPAPMSAMNKVEGSGVAVKPVTRP